MVPLKLCQPFLTDPTKRHSPASARPVSLEMRGDLVEPIGIEPTTS